MNRFFIDDLRFRYTMFWAKEVATNVGQTTGMCPNR